MLRVGTWNILGRNHSRRGDTAEPGAVRATLVQHPVDVLCLQEVHFFGGAVEPQLMTELQGAGLFHVVGEPLSPSHLDPRASLGVVIASRYPLKDQWTCRLSNPGLTAQVRGSRWVLHDKGMIGAVMDVEGAGAVQVCSLHLLPFFEFVVDEGHPYVTDMWSEFWRQADRMLAGWPTILAGDFNQENRRNAAKAWSTARWTFFFDDLATADNGMSLDDIAFSWYPDVSDNALWSTFSDHRLAIVKFAIDASDCDSRRAPGLLLGRRS